MIINERESLKSLSPKYWATNINEKVFILHGSHDSMIPFTESLQLAKNLSNSELFISYLYEHSEFSTNGRLIFNFIEILKLIQFYAKFFNHYAN